MFELYAVTDRKMLGDISEVEAARLCYEGGADVVQLRMKDTDGGEMLEKAKAIQEIAQQYCKFFIVNDRLDVAILAGADGVHIGQSDIPVEEARRLVGDEMIIGVSVSTVEEAVKAVEEGADYLGVGAIFNTSTKPDADQGIGLDTLMEICHAVDVPVVAIGGINKGNVTQVIRAGADGAAVVSAIMAKPDIKAAAHELKVMILNEKRNLKR